MKTILIVEDDENIHKILESILDNEGYNLLNAYSGTEALMLIERNNIDLVLLDLMIPGISGENLIKKINHLPIIVLSAKINTDDKVNCLLSGANDYITKPFNKDELLARIKVQLRTNNINKELEYKELKLLPDNHILLIKDNKVNLTKTESAILKQLLINPKEVVTKSHLLDLISLDTEDCNEDSLRVHISNIRKKIRNFTDVEYIESVWGIGFKIKE